ncbi:MAG: response regulator transcription factor [Deltaproteobacteria bacterium]|nr:response regulator transcription factor [Deltaproteobacteria bacterium]
MTQVKVLVAEDDTAIREGTEKYLSKHGYLVKAVSDGEECVNLFDRFFPHVVILDIMLPSLDGYQVCKKIRAKDEIVGILMLTARSEEVDKILGFDFGADDYLPKPFSFPELLARVKALVRRIVKTTSPLKYESPDFKLIIDFGSYTAFKDKTPITLSPKEFKLLYYLISNKNQVITRSELLETVWGYSNSAVSTRTVDNHVARLRLKIEDDPNNPKHLITVHGIGYKFVE